MKSSNKHLLTHHMQELGVEKRCHSPYPQKESGAGPTIKHMSNARVPRNNENTKEKDLDETSLRWDQDNEAAPNSTVKKELAPK